MAENNIINKTCSHGTPRDKLCWHCRDDYIKEDAEEYAAVKGKIRGEKSQKNFELAFKLHKGTKRWFSIMHVEDLQEYLKKIMHENKAQEASLSRESLQMAYYVAKKFPELENLSNRKFPFDWYREIANSSLTEIERKEICKEIERRFERENREVTKKEYRLSSQKIRDMVRRKIREKKKQDFSQSNELLFKYTTVKSCLKRIKRFLSKKDIRRNTPIIFKINPEL